MTLTKALENCHYTDRLLIITIYKEVDPQSKLDALIKELDLPDTTSLDDIFDSYKRLREMASNSLFDHNHYRKLAYDEGIAAAKRDMLEHTYHTDTLRSMTLQQLADIIGTSD